MAANRYYSIIIQKSAAHGKIIFKDSWLMTQMKLDDMPKAFDLPINGKGHFPVLFNKLENYGLKMDTLPPLEEYM